MTELIIQTGKHQGKKIDLAGNDCIVGRHESCKIRISSADVSKQHCRLKHKEGGVHAKDLGSRNGTFVNDELLDKETLLKPGDLLRVGPMTFLISEAKPISAADVDSTGSDVPEKDADDDLIASWLSEGGEVGQSGQDTVMTPAPQKVAADKTVAAPAADSGDNAQKSVRDRAKAIIRRWQNENGKG